MICGSTMTIRQDSFDARDVPVSCSERPVLELYEKALLQYQTYVGDPIATIEEALNLAPTFVLGHVFRSVVLMTMAEKRFAREARISFDRAKALLNGANSRERI